MFQEMKAVQCREQLLLYGHVRQHLARMVLEGVAAWEQWILLANWLEYYYCLESSRECGIST